jgi:hypothetical protein
LDIAIQRTLNTIEKTGSPDAEERLKHRETEKLQTKVELERLRLQLSTAKMEISPEAMSIILETWRTQFDWLRESGNVREIKSWLLQFVSRIDLGYNRARIFYTYPIDAMKDLTLQGHGTQGGSLGPLARAIRKPSRSFLCYNGENT